MNAVTRWKTIATIALAFSAGNLFSTACQNAGGGKAHAEDGTTAGGDGTTAGGDGTTPPPDLADVERDIASIKCVLRYLEDVNQNGESNTTYIFEEHIVNANDACGI